MSNFNITAPNAGNSAISLGGEWRNHDRMQANKYKMSGLANRAKKKPKGKTGSKEDTGRPKSEPSSQQRRGSSPGSQAPSSSAPPGVKQRCDRVYDVEQEPAARKSLDNHLPLKKTRAVSRDEQSARQYKLGAGMVLTRGRSKVAVTINTGEEEDIPRTIPRASYQGSSVDPEREALIAQLQQQVSDLTLFLEEERLNHKATKDKLAITLKEKLQDVERKHMEELRGLQQDQDDQLDMMKQLHGKELEHHKSASNAVLGRMKGELEFLQGAFEAYKGTLVQDMEEKWAKKESDMKIRFQEDMDKAIHEQRTDLLEDAMREKKNMNREFQRQIQLMNRDHKKEIEGMMNRFSSTSADVANLKRALEQLKRVQTQLDEKTDKLAVTEDNLKSTQHELQQLKVQLSNYKETFQDKVDEVDDKYKERIHLLMTENAELRRRYLQKCDELFTEKSVTEVKRVEKVTNTKELMQMLVHVKNRSNINIACADPLSDSKPRIPILRPVSAPGTKREALKAFRKAGETGHLKSSSDRKSPVRRPHTTYGQRKLSTSDSSTNSAQGALFIPLARESLTNGSF
ncbi:leucine-rich repeat and coiled-coil domain-containing protein 1-like isoform X2 [Asterias rubens]|uniref:leucine-rich repeat and coiled-coil domain-containing protein 1-like isoform X2 n=1 Tax=Asterias rubens TaxID=7604 RepID=UPI001454F7D4|nr:leucine-rich repeat and coiled-coil domain-containing protein 1-like isoform X2 [Asterias rubens]